MTREEAKTKVCPFIYNQLGHGDGGHINCICGDCMAWEWTKTHGDNATERYTHKEGGGYTSVRYRCPELPDDEKEGYCKRLGQ